MDGEIAQMLLTFEADGVNSSVNMQYARLTDLFDQLFRS